MIDEKAEKALRQPDTQAVPIDMTPERKEKFSRLSGQIVDLLRKNTENPLEAYMVLHFVQHAFEERYGIRGGIVLGDGDEQ